MGLFVKKTNTGTHAPLYTLGAEKTVLIVGLGNIGEEYALTRHNVGFSCVDAYAKNQDFPEWVNKKDLRGTYTSRNIGDVRVILFKPSTLMNRSGEAVQSVQHFFKLSNSNLLVVHDELDLNFGQIRTRFGGGSAGNNGIKSLIQHINADFRRVRIGIKNDMSEKMDSADFVLAKWSAEEKEKLPTMQREVINIINEFVFGNDLAHETRSFLI